MQTTQPKSPTSESGFDPIPTRIENVPPLIVDKVDDATKEQVTSSLRDLSSNLAQVHRTAAEAYLSQNMYEEALPHAQAAATFAPAVPEYQNQLGFIAYVSGHDEIAIKAFESVLSMQPSQPDALFNLGMVWFGQSEFSKAHDCFRRCLEIQKHDAETWNNLGVCCHQLGQLDDAQTCFNQALQLDPQNEDARINLQAIAR